MIQDASYVAICDTKSRHMRGRRSAQIVRRGRLLLQTQFLKCASHRV